MGAKGRGKGFLYEEMIGSDRTVEEIRKKKMECWDFSFPVDLTWICCIFMCNQTPLGPKHLNMFSVIGRKYFLVFLCGWKLFTDLLSGTQ